MAVNPFPIRVKVTEVADLKGAGAKRFVLSPVAGKTLPAFRAGQYISLLLDIDGSHVTRPYSLCSSPADAAEGRYAVTIQNNPGGFAADRINAGFRVGTELTILSPCGDYYYQPGSDVAHVVAVAGGSGITPFLSMALAIRDGLEDFNLTILNCNRTADSAFYMEELARIAAASDKVEVVNVLSDERRAGCEFGFADAALIRRYGEKKGNLFSVFACGPAQMYAFLRTEIPFLQLPPRYVRFEAPGVTQDVFSESDYPEHAAGKLFRLSVIQGRDTHLITADSRETVLVALERGGLTARSSCRSGVCGWCSSRLISGQCYYPELNDRRTPAEISGGIIHPCAAFPVSDLVLEIPEVASGQY